MISHSKILALTLGAKSILIAELSAKGAGRKPAILNLAEFIFPDNLSVSTPVELGQALSQFLRKEKISTRDAVIGLPARRLVTRRKELPPASPAIAASALRLQAESDFAAALSSGPAGEPDSFVVDYTGKTSTSDPSSVLLIATAQSCIDQCLQLARAANLRLRGITAAAAALARATTSLAPASVAGGGGDALILSLAPGAAELVVQQGQSPTQLRHIAIGAAGAGASSAAESLSVLAGEIRRSVASLQRNGAPITLALWDGSGGTGDSPSNLLAERLGMPVTSPDLRSLAIQAQGLQSPGSPNAYAPAVAVALAAFSPAGLPVDFLHSRLAPPKQSSNKRPIVIALASVAAVLLVIIAGVVDLHLKQNTLDALRTKSQNQSAQVKVAQTAANRLALANLWIHRPAYYVPCLRDLTILLPDTGNTIWATSLTLSADGKGNLAGLAVDQNQISALKEKMLDSKQFINPGVTYSGSHTTAGNTEVAFSIEFVYRPLEPKNPEPKK